MHISSLKIPAVALFIGLLASCAGTRSLITVLVEGPDGNTELIYKGVQSPDNLLKEVRYYPNHDTLSVTPMMHGAVNGMFRNYYQGNVLKDETSYQKGVQDGTFRKYDKQGVLVFEGGMKNGVKDGVWTTWYDEVQKKEQRTYVNGQLQGKWSYWYMDGNLRRDETYDNGERVDFKDYN